MSQKLLIPIITTLRSSTLFSFAVLIGVVTGCGSSSGPTLADRTNAAQKTVENNTDCTSLISPDGFYWEIGDESGSLVSGAVGTTYTASTSMDIASASKLIFGAYVVERYKDNLSQANAQAMRMGSGYVSFDYTACMNLENGNPSTTVDDCFKATHGLTANNHYNPLDVGHFYYNGGHFQFYADDNSLNLGDKTNATLADEMKNQLGQGLNIAYSSPQLAGGAHLTPGDYAQFLQKIVSGGLAIRDHLGEDPVCTNKDTCDTAIYSPAYPYNWHYSWGHWIEDDPNNGDDGAFSSPGAFGFYPWIDASKKYYGILARRETVLDAVLENASPYKDSAMCGRHIRKAFLTGIEQ